VLPYAVLSRRVGREWEESGKRVGRESDGKRKGDNMDYVIMARTDPEN
jgi:hypothetical protein